MLLNSADNLMVESSVDEALKYFKNNMNLQVNINCVMRVTSQNLDGNHFLQYICEKYVKAVSIDCKPDLIIDLTVGGDLSRAAKTFSGILGIPTVAAAHAQFGNVWPSNLPNVRQWLHLVQVSPPADVMLHIIRSISILQKMRNVAIIYDNYFRLDMLSRSVLEDAEVRQILLKIEDFGWLEVKMAELRELDIVNFFILGSLHTARVVIDSMVHDSYYNTKFAWYILTQDEGKLRCVCKNITVLLIKPTSKVGNDSLVDTTHKGFLPDISFYFYFELTIRAILSLLSFTLDNKNITVKHFPRCPQAVKLTQSNIDFREYFHKTEQSNRYGIVNFKENWSGMTEFEMSLELVTTVNYTGEVVGYWSSKDKKLYMFGDISHHLAKPIYRIATIVLAPFLMINRDENGTDHYSGYCIDLIEEISQKLGFQFELYKVPDNTPGSMNEHGKWSGVINEVLEKRADIGLSSLSVTAERQDVVEFTMPFYDLVGMNILMKKSKPSTAFFKFFSAMGRDVWLCLLAVYILASAMIWTFEKFSPIISHNQLKQLPVIEHKREFTIKECLWFCMISLTPQGSGEGLKTKSALVTTAIWWLFGFIIIASYTANLAAFLTVSRLDKSINSLEDLAKQYKIQYAPLNGSSGMTYFQRMAAIEARFHREWKNQVLRENTSEDERATAAVWNHPVSNKFTKMWKAMQEAKMPTSLQDAIDRVLASRSSTEGFAFISDGPTVKFCSLLNCNLREVGQEFCKLPLAIVLQKGSPLTERLNEAINYLLHKRRLNQLKEKWWDENPERKICPQEDDLAEGISIYNIGGVFCVMLIGTFLACLILFFEYCSPKQVFTRNSRTHTMDFNLKKH